MKRIKLMNSFLSDLHIMNVKLHNLHWNVVGGQFVPVHEFSEVLYDEMFEAFDEVAERIKMLGEYPLSSVKDYLENSKIEELPVKDYKDKDVLGIILEDIKYLRKLSEEVRNISDEEGDFVSVALFEGYVEKYDKHIWFINSTLK